MNGVHDMGGMDGFGKVEPEPNEPLFHAAWEGARAGAGARDGHAGAWHIDKSRAAQELCRRRSMRRVLLPALGARHGEARWSSAGWPAPTSWRPATRCARQAAGAQAHPPT